MVKHAKTNLHFELERSISRKVDSKLIAYQVSLSDGFYDKYTNYGIKPIHLILSSTIVRFMLS